MLVPSCSVMTWISRRFNAHGNMGGEERRENRKVETVGVSKD